MSRLTRDWRVLGADQRLAAGASALLFFTMFLPWYQQNAVVTSAKTGALVSRNLDAFAVFSFVEAAVLLVALAVLFMLFARAELRDFHLPGGDGTVVFGAGLWVALLLVWRLFDKPGIITHGVAANVGIQWGIFFALAGAGLLAYAGSRMRGARRPEPPLMRPRPRRGSTSDLPDEPVEPETPVVRARRGPADGSAPSADTIADTTPVRAGARARRPPAPRSGDRPGDAPTERLSSPLRGSDDRQLSFEDSPPEPD